MLLPLSFLLVLVCVAEAQNNWTLFKSVHQKSYHNANEERSRRGVFEQNIAYIHQHNVEAALGLHTFTLAANYLADMTLEERLGMFKQRAPWKQGEANHNAAPRVAIPDVVDWRTKNYVTGVKVQGSTCAAGWAFAAVGAIEAQYYKATRILRSLSAQQLVDCDKTNSGCKGGDHADAYTYIRDAGGVNSDADYPYRQQEGLCSYDKTKIAAQISNYAMIANNEYSLMYSVAEDGPASVTIDATNPSFHFYKTGIYVEPNCKAKNINHGVLVVGYDDIADYWIIKNSFGTTWGENGYMRLIKDHNNHCGVATRAAMPVV